MRKLSILLLLVAGLWAFIPPTHIDDPTAPHIDETLVPYQGYDISVDTCWPDPDPAMVDEVVTIWAQLTNHYMEPFGNVPIHGLIAQLVDETIWVDEDFEEPPFPPDDWDTVMTNPNSSGSIHYHWWRYDYGQGYNNGVWGAYVWWVYGVQDEWLITPEIDLSGLALEDGAKLIFASSFYPTAGEQWDYVCVSTDGGSTWEDTLIDLTHDTGDPTGVWVLMRDMEFDLSAYSGEEIRIGFNYYFEDPPWFVSRGIWVVDDVFITTQDYDVIWTSDEVISSIGAGATLDYEFVSTWTPTDPGVYLLRCWTDLQDADMSNNMAQREFVVGSGVDLAMEAIERPEDYEPPGTIFRPYCIVNSRGVGACTALVRCDVEIPGTGQVVYEEELEKYPLEPGYNHVQEFPEFTVGDARTLYHITFVVEHPDDPDTRDNSLDKTFKSGWRRMVNPIDTSMNVPQEGEEYGNLTPQALFRNEGESVEDDWWAFVRIEDMTYHTELWRDSVNVTDPGFLPLADTSVQFGSFVLSPGLDYSCIFWTEADVLDYGSSQLGYNFLGATGIDEQLPDEYALEVTSSIAGGGFLISYALPKAGNVSLRIYDITGKLVDVVMEGESDAGLSSVPWNGKGVPSGLYFLRMIADDYTATEKLVFIR